MRDRVKKSGVSEDKRAHAPLDLDMTLFEKTMERHETMPRKKGTKKVPQSKKKEEKETRHSADDAIKHICKMLGIKSSQYWNIRPGYRSIKGDNNEERKKKST